MKIGGSRFSRIFGYLAAAGIPAASNFLLTLVLVRSLGIQGFAEWSIIEPVLIIGGAAITLGTQFGALHATASMIADRRSILMAAFAVSVLVSVPAATLGGLSFGDVFGTPLGVAFGLALCTEALAVISSNSLRGMNWSGALATFEAIRSLGLLLITSAIYWWKPTWIETPAAFLGYRFAITGIAVITVTYIIGLSFRVDRKLVKEMIIFGIPILAANVIALAMSSVDRYFLTWLNFDQHTLVTYVTHQRLAGAVSVAVVAPLEVWFPGEVMRRNNARNELFFRSSLVCLLVVLVIVECIAMLVAPLVWSTLFPQITFSWLLFLFLAASVVPQSLAIVLNIGALRRSKTGFNILGAAIGCGANVALGLPLTAAFGGMGAAAARFGAFLAYMLAFRAISQRIAPVRHSMFRLLPLGVALGLVATIPLADDVHIPSWLSAVGAAGFVALGVLANARTLRQGMGGSSGRSQAFVSDREVSPDSGV